ncbi:MAG: hypothetical protein Q7J55_03215, partial [bacterium]|nr:hypothetical protein [bacterium]
MNNSEFIEPMNNGEFIKPMNNGEFIEPIFLRCFYIIRADPYGLVCIRLTYPAPMHRCGVNV